MSGACSLLILSDIHYAGEAEQARPGYEYLGLRSPVSRLVMRAYRHYLWQKDPFAHNHLLDHCLAEAGEPDLVVANGDYSCDSAFIGVIDDAAFQSASVCLGKLRTRFGTRLHAGFGDHELGKKSFGGGLGGMRIASWRRAVAELKLPPLWQTRVGRYTLIGVTSSLLALPVYARDALPEELPQWEALRAAHVEEIRDTFNALPADQRIILFCHDPTALPFLGREAAVRRRLPQIEQTIIGHLHTELVLRSSRFLSGMPRLRFLGATPNRLSAALHEAKHWRPFRVRLCPSLAGIQLLRDGGYYTAKLDLEGKIPAQFQFIPLAKRFPVPGA